MRRPPRPLPRPTLQPIELPPWGVLVGESVHGPNFELLDRREVFDKLLYIHAGRVRLDHGDAGNSILLGPGAFVFVPRGVVHSLFDETPATVFFVCFRPEVMLGRATAELQRRLKSRLTTGLQPIAPARQEAEMLLREALVRQRQVRELRGFALQTVTQRLLLVLAECERADTFVPAPDRIQVLLERMRQQYFAEWDIERAAAVAGLSRRQFTRAFRAVTGNTFLTHLTQLRLDEAARLMRQGRMTIAGTAFCCGFQDLSHFYRLFSRRFGMPPGRYQHQFKD